MKTVDIITVKIADVDPREVYKACPCCGGMEIITDTEGVMCDWRQCEYCETWFHPEVQFEV